jgi:hypothetical protein
MRSADQRFDAAPLRYTNGVSIYRDNYGRDLPMNESIFMVDQWLGFTTDPTTAQQLRELRHIITACQEQVLQPSADLPWGVRFFLLKAMKIAANVLEVQPIFPPTKFPDSKLTPVNVYDPQTLGSQAGAAPAPSQTQTMRQVLEQVMNLPKEHADELFSGVSRTTEQHLKLHPVPVLTTDLRTADPFFAPKP